MYRFKEVFDSKGYLINKRKLRAVNRHVFHKKLELKHIIWVSFLFLAWIIIIIILMRLGSKIMQLFADMNIVVSLLLTIALMMIMLVIALFLFAFFLYVINKDIEKNNKKRYYEKFYEFFILDDSGKRRDKILIYSCYESVDSYFDKVKKKVQLFFNLINLMISLIVSTFIIDKITVLEISSEGSEIAKFIIITIVYLLIDYFEKSIEEIFENIQDIIGADYNSLVKCYREYIDFGFSKDVFKKYNNLANSEKNDNGIYSRLYSKMIFVLSDIKKVLKIKCDGLKMKFSKFKREKTKNDNIQ